MKSILSILLLLPLFAHSQSEKGVTPLSDIQTPIAHTTRAVVVGISNYQDEKIPDLRFADKDAEAFANFLRSQAGGSLNKDHLKLMTNNEATMAQFATALDWLWEETKEGDEAIIYFSGHGDVEKKSLTQPGFLLCWDAPATVYMAGGAFALPMLQEVISTLSIQNKAKVILITDACRSGKLAGSSVAGSQLTSSNLGQQYANEIKILSCQPNEYSIEGEQWGGGRGAFSFNLVDALYGLADVNNDLSVTLQEVGRYLEDHVTAEVSPVSQVPMVIGNRSETLATVDAKLLAKIQAGKTNQMAMLSPIETRGMEDEVLADVDTTVRKMYRLFKQSLKDKTLLEPKIGQPATACAEAYYQRLIQEPKLERLHSTMRRNYAAALQDDAQMAINDYLKSPMKELQRRQRMGKNYENYPKYLARAAELLGMGHYMYPNLKARAYYFEGLLHRLSGERNKNVAEYQLAKSLQYRTLEVDSNAAFAWNELGLLERRLEHYSQAIPLFEQALNYAPQWALAYSNIAATYVDLDQNKEAEQACKIALAIDSNLAVAQYNLGLAYYYQSDLKGARKQYLKALELDPDYSSAIFKLGITDYMEGDYASAETRWRDYTSREPEDPIGFNNLGFAMYEQGKNEEAAIFFQKALDINSVYLDAIMGMVTVLIAQHKTTAAISFVERTIELKVSYEELMEAEDLAPLRTLPEWEALIKKHFPPEKNKE